MVAYTHFILDVSQRVWVVYGETYAKYVGLRIACRAETVVITLTCCVP